MKTVEFTIAVPAHSIFLFGTAATVQPDIAPRKTDIAPEKTADVAQAASQQLTFQDLTARKLGWQRELHRPG